MVRTLDAEIVECGSRDLLTSYLGRESSLLDSGGWRITMTYDAASRITTSIQGALVNTHSYDANGSLTNEQEGE